MQYKVYTLQHQELYNQIHSIQNIEKYHKIINKETFFLQEKCRELRHDFSILSKVKEFDALFTDVLIKNKKKAYAFEHIVVKANKIFVLERKKPYDNQKQLIKEKTNYLRKIFGKNIPVEFYILTDNKTTKPNFISIDKFIESTLKIKGNDAVASKVRDFVETKHISLGIKDYLQKKYNINISQPDATRRAKWVEVFKYTNPLVSKYKGTLSFMSSGIIFFYVLTSVFSYSIYAKEKQFLLTIAIDCLFLFFLVNLLKEIESKLPRLLKWLLLTIGLCMFVFLFGRVIYYL